MQRWKVLHLVSSSHIPPLKHVYHALSYRAISAHRQNYVMKSKSCEEASHSVKPNAL